jgi:hypothetical protein
MSVNKYGPHVLVLPEDDANRQLANGFLLDHALSTRSVQVLGEAGGWNKVIDCFLSDHVAGMERYPKRHMVLLIDFDGDQERLSRVKEMIPGRLAERVYVLGALNEPEDLKRAGLGSSFEPIGSAMAKDCREGTDSIWSHNLLRHNKDELDRLRELVRPILFPSA